MAEQLTGRQQVKARIQVSIRLAMKYMAEAAGLEASLANRIDPEWTENTEDYERYSMGFKEGREILKTHGDDAREVA